MRYQRSSKLFKIAKEVIPGGVNSPVRAFKAVGGSPIFIKRAKGAYLYDEDNNRYIDYINSWGPMILGHSHKPIIDAIITKVKSGTSYGIPTEIETKIAQLAISMVPNIDKIRFVNSGTEACMSAIRLARGFTGKEKIIKFKGCYHGHSDSFLIEAGSGAITFGSPSSPGVTNGTAKDTLLAPFNNLDCLHDIFKKNQNQIAAIIVEPVAGNMGCIPPIQGFLEKLRNLCDANGALLIFDEVMTGFRLARGGVQELYGINADIVCFGKVIGGGLPVGAFAASNEIMEYLVPDGPVYQAGTLSGNPLAMSAGYTLLKILNSNPDIYNSLAKKTAYLQKGISDVLSDSGINFTINSVGSMMSVHFSKTSVSDFKTAALANNKHFKQFFHDMLDSGVYLPPSAFESWFITDALTYEDLDFTISAVKRFSKNFMK